MEHEQNASEIGNKLKIGLALNLAFSIFEFIIGFFSGSLALISDAGHNLADVFSLIVSFLANKFSQKQADNKHTYGHSRSTILAPLLNSIILVVVAIIIFVEAYHRLKNPYLVQGKVIILVAIVGIVINSIVAAIFYKNRADLNSRSVFVNMAADAVALVVTLFAGVLIIVTKQPIIDPIVSILIGIMLLYAAGGIAFDASHILLEGIPEGMNFEEVKTIIQNNPFVKEVDDLHIWVISSNSTAMSCHITVENTDIRKCSDAVAQIKKELKQKFQKFHFDHMTIETGLADINKK